MSDTITKDEVVIEETPQQQNEAANQSTQLQAAFWDEKTPVTSNQEQKTETSQTQSQETKDEFETFDEKDWLKKNFEVEDINIVKGWKDELEKLKQQTPQEELKFANEDSKKLFNYVKNGEIDKAHEMWGQQKTISKLLDGEVDERKATEIIKFNLSTKKDFTEADVERKFNRQYGIPKEPVYDEVKETEDEFKARHEEWRQKVSDIKADMILDAKELKPNLEKLKSELVLPDIFINNQETKREPTQEELAAFGKQKDSFLEATDKFLNEFNGFSTQVKDKDVDYNVSYGTSKEEKELIKNVAKEFAESGFDANALFVKDWVNKDGTLNVRQIIEDKMLLTNKEKVFQKIANDAANQRLELYLKEKKNIKVDNSGGKDFGAGKEQQTQSQQLQESFWNN